MNADAGTDATPRVAIVGGGLAGSAAAAALAAAGLRVELFESRRNLGGRTTSFVDPGTGEEVDYCQHVSMGCCTNLADFCRRMHIEHEFRRDRMLHFFGPEGDCHRVAASRWLPAPAHLATSLLRLSYLPRGDRLAIARGLVKLARLAEVDGQPAPTAADWLSGHGQSAAAVKHFWNVVLQSALGETVDRASIHYARKVFVDAFLTDRAGYEVLVPRQPLGRLFGDRVRDELRRQGVGIHLESPVRCIQGDERHAAGIELVGGTPLPFDYVIAAVPWHRLDDLFAGALRDALPELACPRQLRASPITGVHLWFDRPITDLPHAVLVGRLSQWLFNRDQADDAAEGGRHYYQVVVSASSAIASRPREEVVDEICGDLRSLFPAARGAKLVHWRMVTDRHAVFSVGPDVDCQRPPQQTSVANLVLAGDWTRTGWPATMEGAVRSGYLAAEAVLRRAGRGRTVVVDDLAPSRWARMLIGRRR